MPFGSASDCYKENYRNLKWSWISFFFFEGLFIQGVSLLCISRNLKQLRLSLEPERCPGLGNYKKHAFIWTWGEGACFCASGWVVVMFLGWAVGVGWRPVGNVDCKLSAFHHMTCLQLFCDRTHLVWPSSTPKFYCKPPFLSVFCFLFVLALRCKSTFLKNTHNVTSVSRGRAAGVCVCVCVSSQGLSRVYVGVFYPLCVWKAAKDEVAVMKMAFFQEIKALKRENKKRGGMKVAFEDLYEKSGHKVSSTMRRKEEEHQRRQKKMSEQLWRCLGIFAL